MEKTTNRANHWLIKMTAILAVCVLLLVGVTFLRTSGGASASELAEQTITLSNVTINRGQEFDVDVNIQNNGQGIQAIRLLLTYDTSAISLVSIEAKDPEGGNGKWSGSFTPAGADQDGTYASYGTSTKPAVLLWIGTSKLYGEGTIATLHFLSKTTAAAQDYPIAVTVDENSTLLSLGEKRTMTVTGGKVTMLPGAYSLELLDDYGNRYAFKENNAQTVTIAQVWAERDNVPPAREATSKFTYTFLTWRLVEDSPENHPVYAPTYHADPVQYTITFKRGIKEDGSSTVRYTGENTSEAQKDLYYADIIAYDNYIPTAVVAGYTFNGWYTDEACTQPVNFVTMPDANTTVYGYYRFNADEPGVTTTALQVETEVVGGYVIATVSVSENYGFNTLRFAPTFSDKLEFAGFLYESDSPFYGVMDAGFPEINDNLKANLDPTGVWQELDGETLAGKYFTFANANSNVFITGKLIKLRFTFKANTTGDATVGVSVQDRDVTRYAADGTVWYANAKTIDATTSVLRIEKPTAYLPADNVTYTYAGGAPIQYAFKTVGGKNYYTVSDDATQTQKGDYVVTVSLKEVQNTVVTWEDGTTAALEFPFEILPLSVTKPVPADVTYTYDGNEKVFAFTQASSIHRGTYYTVSGDTQTAAGTNYQVTASLIADDNIEWEGGTTADLTFPFVIGKKQVVKPTEYLPQDNKTYTYNYGTNVEYEFKTTGGYADYDVSDDAVQTDAGEYEVTVSLSDTDNTEWEDGTSANLVFAFVIGKRLLPTPVIAAKQYTGFLQTADVTLTGEEPYELTTNAGGVDKGVYDVVFTIKNASFVNFGWAESATASVTAAFRIEQVLNEWTVTPFVTNKTYDGAPITTSNATAKNGEVVITFASETELIYSATAPSDAGKYYAKFSVAGTSSYGALEEVVPFEIFKVRLTAPTDTVKSYVYTGNPQTYEFENAGDTEQYTVTGGTRTGAGTQTVTVSINNKTNYIWKGATQSEDTILDKTYEFTIEKAGLTIPVPAEKAYIYSGNEHTFEFSTAGDTDRYVVTGDKRTEAGTQTVTCAIIDKENYKWADNTAEDKTYTFSVRYASLTASTDGAAPYAVTLTSRGGFAFESSFSVATGPNAGDWLAVITAADKKGALGQISDSDAAALLVNKCVLAYLVVNLSPAAGEGVFDYAVTLPALRTGVVAVRIAGEDVEVFETTATENVVSFSADRITDIILLSNHACVLEVADEAFLKTPATCDQGAVYYKSCSCGAVGEETFVYGDPLGHDYDYEHILWTWSGDHLSATATVTCKRNDAHTHVYPTQVSVVSRTLPGKDTSGEVVREASFSAGGNTYRNRDREILPADGHLYSESPAWVWKVSNGVYTVKAVFTCDCGESVVTLDAGLTADPGATKILYTAEVVFRGGLYRDQREEDRPVVIFDFNDGVTDQISRLAMPGDSVSFPEAPARAEYLFAGWRDGNGALVVKDDSGEFFEYKVGFGKVIFTAEWRSLASVGVVVVNSDNEPIQNAEVALYYGDTLCATILSSATGNAAFIDVPYGNYKLVVTSDYVDGAKITRSSDLDIDKAAVNVTVVLPKNKFNTIIEGDGSSEGLEDVISDDEKDSINDGTDSGTINEIVITQKRITDVPEEIKQEIRTKQRRDDPTGQGTITDFYDVTVIKTTTTRNASGVQFVKQESITVAERFQTNIFPLTAELRKQIASFGGNAENAFVYKRHVYDTGVVVICQLPKLSEAEGERSDIECFFIKRVAGEEYIAIRQKEYSVLALGVSPDPVMFTNEITSLSIANWTFGSTASVPSCEARYGAATVRYTYATAEDGEYTANVPTAAGTYFVKAFIPASDTYAAAERVESFRILKKTVARPTADQTKYVYSGTAQTYGIAANSDYVVTGNVQTDAGKYVVTVALADTANTLWDSGFAEPVSFEFVIEKKALNEVSGIKFEDKKFWFNGKKHCIEISGDLPEGIEVVYQGNGEADLGKYKVTATFVSTNPNYDVSEPMIAEMQIRLNWIPLVILAAIVLVVLIIVIVIVEKLLKKLKNSGENQQNAEEGSDNE